MLYDHMFFGHLFCISLGRTIHEYINEINLESMFTNKLRTIACFFSGKGQSVFRHKKRVKLRVNMLKLSIVGQSVNVN